MSYALKGGSKGGRQGRETTPAHSGVSRYLANPASRQKYTLDGMWQDNEVILYLEHKV